MSDTTHLKLPYLSASQAQKHVTHNEALTRLDGLVQLAVISRAIATPPATPAEGDRYLIAASATGGWAGQSDKIALRLDGQWHFVSPREGFAIWVNDEDTNLWFTGSTWVAGAAPTELQNMALLGVNALADANAKLTVASATTLLNHDGNGHQLKINKASASDTSAILLQTGFSGRAEIGLAGDDNLHIKVSANGASFVEALNIATADGSLTATQSLKLGHQTSDLSSPDDGQIWYNQNTGKFRKRQAGVTTDLDTVGGGSGAGLSDGDYGDVSVSGGASVLVVEAASGAFALSGTITPALLTANQNNYAPAGLATCSVVRLSSDSDARTITGFAGGTAGRLLTIHNVGAQDIVFEHEAIESNAVNRISCSDADLVLAPDECAVFQYDVTLQRWNAMTTRQAALQDENARRRPIFFSEFMNATSTASPPFTGASISSGSAAITASSIDANHPGIIRLSSSATANSGFRWQTDLACIRLGGSEHYEIIFRPLNFATSTYRFGLHDASTAADAVDGVYFETNSTGQIVGKTSNNSVRTTSAAIAVLALNTWYRARLSINRTATAVNFEVFNGNGVSLGAQTVTTNIPTALGREVGAGLVVTNSGTVATAIADIDYVAFGFGARRPIIR